MTKLHTVKKIIPATLIAGALCAPTYAQTAAPAGNGLEEIIVTAQKRNESLQETPLAVSAVTADTIEARAITSVADLGTIAPSLTVTGATAGPNNAGIFIRGLGNQDPILTADSPVAIYVDGVVLARSSGSAFDVADLERIEVLRGPQGTLYGRNTIGGAINLITRKPAEAFGFRQTLSIGNYNYRQSRTTVDTGELGDSGVRALLTYLHKQRDGYVDDINASASHDPGAYRTDGGRVALAYDQNTGFRANYAFDYNRNKGFPNAFQLTAARPDLFSYFAGSPAAGGGTFTVSGSRLGKISLDDNAAIIDRVQGHTLTLEADIGDATLKSLTGYRKWSQDVPTSDQDGNGYLLGPLRGQGPTPQPITLFGSAALRHQHQWSEELNLIGKVGDTLDYVLGAYYFEEKADENNPQHFGVILPAGALSQTSLFDYTHKSSTKALFAQSTYHVNDRFSVTGGLRSTWDHKRLDQSMPLRRTLDKNFSKVNWALTADYRFDDDIMGYARVATGYKAGGFNARSFDNGFKPENLTSYEVGLKSELFDHRLRFNTAVYYADHKDVQVSSFQAGASGATALTDNAGKATYKGIEVEMDAVLAPGLTTYVTAGYVDRSYDEFIVFSTAMGRSIDIANIAKFANSAATTLNAGAQYEFPHFDFGKLTARLDYSYLSRRYFNPNPLTSPFNSALTAPSRGLVDARLTLSELTLGKGQASVSLWGKNITNEKYRVAGIDFGALGFAGNVYGVPATWGLDVDFRL
jgi:iron complex outermembrane receptor protein